MHLDLISAVGIFKVPVHSEDKSSKLFGYKNLQVHEIPLGDHYCSFNMLLWFSQIGVKFIYLILSRFQKLFVLCFCMSLKLTLILLQKCTGKQHTKRSVSQMESEGKHAAVVSAGPLIVNTRVKSATPSYCKLVKGSFSSFIQI